MENISIQKLIEKIRLLIKKEKKTTDEERLISEYKGTFNKLFTQRIKTAGKLDIVELNNDSFYKVYYLNSKKVTRTRAYEYILKEFKEEHFAELLFDDIFIYNYNIDGEGNYTGIELPYEKKNPTMNTVNSPVATSVPVKTPINSQVNPQKNLKKTTPNKSQQINVNSQVKPLVILKKTSPIPSKDKQIELIKKNLGDKILNLDDLNDRIKLKEALEILNKAPEIKELPQPLIDLITKDPVLDLQLQDSLEKLSLKDQKSIISNLLQSPKLLFIKKQSPKPVNPNQQSNKSIVNPNQQPISVSQRGGRQVVCNIYHSFNDLISINTPKQLQINKEILVSALCAKLAYLNLGFYLSKKDNKDRNHGYLNFKQNIDSPILNNYSINNVELFIADDKRTEPPELLNHRSINGLEFNSPNNYFYTNPQNNNVPTENNKKSHLISLYKWLDTEQTADPFSKPDLNHFMEKLYKIIKCSDKPISLKTYEDVSINGRRGDDMANPLLTNSSSSSAPTPDDNEPTENVGMIRYYLMYDMNIKKFVLGIRGTDFGGDAGIDNFGINAQFGLYNMRKYYEEECVKGHVEEETALQDLYNFAFQIIVDAIYELQLTIPFLKTNPQAPEGKNWTTIFGEAAGHTFSALLSNPFGAATILASSATNLTIELGSSTVHKTANLIGLTTSSNNFSGIIIHILYSETIKPSIESIIRLLVTTDKNRDDLKEYLVSALIKIRDKLKDDIYGLPTYDLINIYGFIIGQLITQETFMQKSKEIINRFVDIFVKYIKNDYLIDTIKYSEIILCQCKQIIFSYGYSKDDLIITGHSLGGGLTEILGGLKNISSYTFNPAPTRSALSGFTRKGGKERFIHKSEFSLFGLASTITGLFTTNINVMIRSLVTRFTYLDPITTKEVKFLFEDNIKNIVIAQDYIHKIKLTSDFNRLHIGKVYVVSDPMFENFYKESYIVKGPTASITAQTDNVTSFHGIEELFLLLSKIFNSRGICLDDINPAIYSINRYDGSNFHKINPIEFAPNLSDTTSNTTLDTIGDNPPTQSKEVITKILITALAQEAESINKKNKDRNKYDTLKKMVIEILK